MMINTSNFETLDPRSIKLSLSSVLNNDLPYRFTSSIGKTENGMTNHDGNDDFAVFDGVLGNGSENPISPNSISSLVRMMRESWNRGRRIDQKYFDGKNRQIDPPMRTVLREIEKRPSSDLEKLSAEIWTKIWNRQNPENCDEARLAVIHTWKCGFGSTTHRIVMYLLVAFYSNRTLVLKSNGWGYDAKGWDHYLMPLGKCDYNGTIESLPIQSDHENPNARIVSLTNARVFRRYDWKIPKKILATLKNIHSDPYAWWTGQFTNYVVRFQPWFTKVLAERSERTHITKSTACIQVRWGDKIGSESIKHPVAEYMYLTSTWFERPENQGVKKNVYVATEQSEAWKNLEDNYGDFRFIGSGFVNRSKELDYQKGDHYQKRKNELDAILTDIYFLTKCQYVVCTFSSNICRLLYEVMATHKNEPTNAVQSLDFKFYMLLNLPKCRVIEDHDAGGNNYSIDLKIGDTFIPRMERFILRTDNYVIGKNARTLLTGRVPKYKLEAIVEPLNFDV